jgi:hypothetical protein
MTKTFSADAAALMSPRTIRYVEAMSRRGDDFDYGNWLNKVRQEEAQAKQLRTGYSSGQAGAAGQIGNPVSNAPQRSARASLGPTPVPRVLSRPARRMSDKQPKARVRRWLEKVHVAWLEFQANRGRDAVYDYFDAVFSIVDHHIARRRTHELLRHAFKFASLRFDKNADPFASVIRCTCGGAADNKMISKWARALRYAAIRRPPEMRLIAFMKQTGGVNECAAGDADKRRRHRRPHC